MPFTEALTAVPLSVDGAPGAGADFPSFEPVRAWVLADDHARCLREETFLMSPPPGLEAGLEPELWVQDRVAADARDRGLACYCDLLRDLPAPSDRDARGLSACPAARRADVP